MINLIWCFAVLFCSGSFLFGNSSEIYGVLVEGLDYSGKSSVCELLNQKLIEKGLKTKKGHCYMSDSPMVQFLWKKAKKSSSLLESSWYHASGSFIDFSLFNENKDVFYIQDRSWLSHTCRMSFLHPEVEFMPKGWIDKHHKPFKWNVFLTVSTDARIKRYKEREKRSILNDHLLTHMDELDAYEQYCINKIPKNEKWIIIDTSSLSVDEVCEQILSFCQLPESFVSESHHEFSIRKTVESVFEGEFQRADRLPGGRSTSEAFRLMVSNHPYVLRRIDKNRSHDFYVSIDCELECIKKASDQMIGPKVFHLDRANGLVIMDYIPFIEWDFLHNVFERQQFLERLAITIKTLHEGEPLPSSRSIYEDIQMAIRNIPQGKMPKIALEAIQAIHSFKDILEADTFLRPCHRELNYRNILYDGEGVFFIDWETAGQADPYWDLATISNFLIIDPLEEKLFMDVYLDAPISEEQQAHLTLMKQNCLCLYAFKILRRICQNDDANDDLEKIEHLPNFQSFTRLAVTGCINLDNPKNFRKYALILLNEVVKNIKTEKIEKAIQVLLRKYERCNSDSG